MLSLDMLEMMDENSKEYVVICGKKYFVHNNTLDPNSIPCKFTEIEGLTKLTNLEVLYYEGNHID